MSRESRITECTKTMGMINPQPRGFSVLNFDVSGDIEIPEELAADQNARVKLCILNISKHDRNMQEW